MAEKKASRSTGETKPKLAATSASPTSTVDDRAASNDEVARGSERIEAEIEQTREELGDTVAALAEKTDVKRRAQQKVEETREAAQAKASATAAAAKQKLHAAPDAVSQATDRTAAGVRENPVPALAAVGALLVVGAIVRRRRR